MEEKMKESTSRRSIKEILEVVTSVMVVVGVFLFGFVVYRSLSHPKQAVQVTEPAVGTVLSALPGYSWGQHRKSLVLVVRKGCHYCEDSMPFYRELAKAQKEGESNADLVSVLPDGGTDAAHLLQDAQLDVPIIASFPLQQIHISATPTVILVDRNGKVEKTWVGEQPVDGQKAILSAIRN
jgi:thioredoxin-related protein